MSIHQPHDKLIKNVLKHKAVSREFFDALLPSHIRNIIELETLELNSTTFIDEKLRGTSCDLLFSTKFAGRPGYLYILCENQSKSDRYMPLRLWRYMLSIMKQHSKTHPNEPLPLIYPLTFFTGKKPYDQSMDFLDLFDEVDRDLARHIMYNPFQLVDLNLTNESDFSKYVMLNTLVMAMKHYQHIDQYLSEMAQLFAAIDQRGETDFACAIINYLVDRGKAGSAKEFIDELHEALPESQRGNMESISQYLVNQGIQKGRVEGEQIGIQKGREEGREEVAVNMLQLGMGTDDVVKCSGLQRAVVEALAEQLKVSKTEH